MNHCMEIRAFLHPFLDGELDVDKNVVVLQHLQLCPPCRTRFEEEKKVFTRVQECLLVERCPDELRVKLRLVIDDAERETRVYFSFRRRAGFAAAAAILLIIPAFAIYDPYCWRGCSTMKSVFSARRELTRRQIPITTPVQLASVLEQELGTPLPLPCIEKLGGCQGCKPIFTDAVVTTIGDTKAALVCIPLKNGNGEISWVCMPHAQPINPRLKRQFPDGHEYFIAREDNTIFVGWQEKCGRVNGFMAPEQVTSEQELADMAHKVRF
jgi:hypothetical protein